MQKRSGAVVYSPSDLIRYFASPFAGFADFLILDGSGRYQVWDTKLARMAMQDGYTGKLANRPEPMPRAEHGRWSSLAEKFFSKTDHLVQVAGISVGQIKKLKAAGIGTVADLATASGNTIRKLANDSFEKLVAQARLQCRTREDRQKNPDARPSYDILPFTGANGEALGLSLLAPGDPADVYFDMEGYPLVAGGLEYLFGVYGLNGQTGCLHSTENCPVTGHQCVCHKGVGHHIQRYPARCQRPAERRRGRTRQGHLR
jgi:predicted RecB family nuclease